MAERLKVLYLTHHGPLPASSGGRLRDAALIPRLARLADLDLWAVSRTPDEDRAALGGWRDTRDTRDTCDWQFGGDWRVYRDDGPVRSYPSRDSAGAAADLRARLNGPDGYDVIHVEGHYLFHLVPAQYRERAVVVEHNVESHLLAQRALAGRGCREPGRLDGGLGPARPGLADVWPADALPAGFSPGDFSAVREREEAVWRAAACLVTLSQEDRARVLDRVPGAKVSVVGNGADHLPRRGPRDWQAQAVADPVVGFLANYRYPPNLDALSWLLTEIFPAIRRQLPRCRLLLAGANLEAALAGRTLPDGVLARGWHADLAGFWDATDVLVCPLRIGGGVKVKMLEALRSGALTVATQVAVEGLPASARAAVSRAETADEFAAATVELLASEPLRHARRAALARAAGDLPSWDEVAEAISWCWLTVAG
jgi:glycosyltransferase involved in cell wall biosynthesis